MVIKQPTGTGTFLLKPFLTYSREYFHEFLFSILHVYSYEVKILLWLQYYNVNHLYFCAMCRLYYFTRSQLVIIVYNLVLKPVFMEAVL